MSNSLILLLTFWMGAPAHPTPPSPEAPAPRSLLDAMRAAERLSPTLEAAQRQSAVKAAEELLAFGGLMPQLSVRGSYQRNQYEQQLTIPQPGSEPLQANVQLLDQFTTTFAARLPLVDAAHWMNIGAARHAQLAARSDESQARDDVHLAAAQAYCAQLNAQASLASASSKTRASEARARLLRSQAEQGTAMEADAVRAEADLARARYNELQARRDLARAQRSLETLTGWPAEILPPLEWENPTKLDEPGSTVRPALRAAQEQEQQLQAALRATDLMLVPRIYADAQQRYSNATGFADNEWQWALGVTVEWSLEPLSVVAGHLQAQAALEAQRARRRDLEQRVRDEEALVRIDVDVARTSLEQARQQLSSAQATAAAMEAKLESGRGLELDLGEAEAAVADAVTMVTQSQSQLAIAELTLRHARGTRLTP